MKVETGNKQEHCWNGKTKDGDFDDGQEIIGAEMAGRTLDKEDEEMNVDMEEVRVTLEEMNRDDKVALKEINRDGVEEAMEDSEVKTKVVKVKKILGEYSHLFPSDLDMLNID